MLFNPPVLDVLAHPSAGTRPVSAYGNPVTPGATNVYGAWADMGIPSTTFDSDLLELFVSNVAVAAASRCTMIDVGLTVDGSASSAGVVSLGPGGAAIDLAVGSPGAYNDGAANRSTNYKIPLRIPAGARVWVRGKQNHATPAILRVAVRTRGKSSAPEHTFVGQVIETIGATPATSQGTAIVPGAASEGSWTLIGTCTRRLKWIDFGYAIDNTVVTGVGLHVDVAYGDGSNFVTVIHDAHVESSAAEAVWHDRSGEPCNIPAGSAIYARAQSGTAAVDAGQTIMLIGVA